MMDLKFAVESILFVHGEPVTVSRLARIAGAKKHAVESVLHELQAEYRERGIILIHAGEEWQFATHPANRGIVEKVVSGELSEDLSRAALEVLAIVAYQGPLSRAKVEYIRGVNSSFVLRNLLIRGLVNRQENPADRRSYLYRVSTDFIKHLGLSNLEELPNYSAFQQQDIAIPDGAADQAAP